MKITADLLRSAVGCTAERAYLFAPFLNDACAHYAINTPARLAAFFAQVGHESGAFQYVREIADGSAYEGRADLGNVKPGDGTRYRGRGLIQVTGRDNYHTASLSMAEAPDFEDFPEALEEPKWAAWSAADWWNVHGCNVLADQGDFIGLGRLINRGSAKAVRPANGEADRIARWERAKTALQINGAAKAPAEGVAPRSSTTALDAAPPFIDTMPAGEAPDWTPPKEPAMAVPAVVAALLPSLINSAPQLIRIFGSGGEVSERNAKAAETVAEIARTVTAQTTTEGAVQVLEKDPEAAARYREEVHAQMGRMLGLLVQAAEADDKSREAALDRNLALSQATGGRWLTLLGGVALIIILASYGITAIVMFGSSFSDETKALVLGQIVILGFGTIIQWLFGSNISNRISQRDEDAARKGGKG